MIKRRESFLTHWTNWIHPSHFCECFRPTPAPIKVSIRTAVGFDAKEEIPSYVASSHHDFLSDLFFFLKKKNTGKKWILRCSMNMNTKRVNL